MKRHRKKDSNRSICFSLSPFISQSKTKDWGEWQVLAVWLRRLGGGVAGVGMQLTSQLGVVVPGRGQVPVHVDGGLHWRNDHLRVAVTRSPDQNLRVIGVGRTERVFLQTNSGQIVQHVRPLLLDWSQYLGSLPQRIWRLHLPCQYTNVALGVINNTRTHKPTEQ